MPNKDLLKRLNIKFPLIVAPMAGGPSSAELVVATTEAGALGSVGAAYSNTKSIQDFVIRVREKTEKPIAINLFIPQLEPRVDENNLLRALQATDVFRKELGIPQPIVQPPYEENFDEQFEMVLKLKPEVFSFVFGELKPDYVKAAKKEKIFLIGTATTLEEALVLENSGVDAITLQGIEGGGHRGIFDADAADRGIPLLSLIRQCQKIKIPLIGAGGVMNSDDIKKVLGLGAQAVQMGTAFLTCQESGISEPYRKALLKNSNRKTKTTRAFSGRLARGLENRFMLEIEKSPQSILPFPAQNKFTRDIRAAATKAGLSDYLSLWAGTGDGELWTGMASDLIRNLFGDDED